MKYRKKPVVIEAIQLLKNASSILIVNQFIEGKTDIGHDLSNVSSDKWDQYVSSCLDQNGIYLKTLESDGQTQKADFGDWIIKGVKGEFYPCKPDIFNLTYEKANDNGWILNPDITEVEKEDLMIKGLIIPQP